MRIIFDTDVEPKVFIYINQIKFYYHLNSILVFSCVFMLIILRQTLVFDCHFKTRDQLKAPSIQ